MIDNKTMLQMARLLETSNAMIAIYDEADRLRFANEAFRAAWFIQEDERPLWSDLMRRNFIAKRGTVVSTDDIESWLRSTQARRGKTGVRSFETDLHDGRWLWMCETTHPNGWMLCIASDITSVQPDERALRQDRDLAIRASQTDELTGIASRRYVMAALDDLVRGSAEGEFAVGYLAVLDIDHFKQINDRFGHSFGDDVLKHFASTLQHLVRKRDVFGRVGGEEFVLIMPSATRDEAERIVDRMLVSIRQSRPLSAHDDFGYTFSAGIACVYRGDDSQDLYRRADLALYAAKMRGRNQVCFDLRASRRTA